jgi:hypothetical protein
MKIVHQGHAYEIDLNYTGDYENLLRVTMVATRTPLPPPQPGQYEKLSLEVQASVVPRNNAPWLVIEIAGKEVFAQPLEEVLGGSSVVDAIPAYFYGGGDPMIGCLIRAGVSASVDQIMACYRRAESREGIGHRIKLTCKCVAEKIPDLTFVAIYRTGLCIARAGF